MYDFIEVIEIEEIEETEDTYDITVEDNHNFFANGMLVHNCLGGIAAIEFWKHREEGSEAVLDAMRNIFSEFKSILGDRWYGELQFNTIPEQHELNLYVIQICKEMDIKMVVTADAHYPRPEMWRDREIYKRFGWFSNEEIPETVEEIGYKLYPKNGDEIFESYKESVEKLGLQDKYEDSVVIDAIQETYNIAHNVISDFSPDTSYKYPSFIVKEGKTADQQLAELAVEKMQEVGLDKSEVYIDRLKVELGVIMKRSLSSYFLTMDAIRVEACRMMLIGPGRGSVCGSLLAYVLGISEVDPIRWNTQFERFLLADAKDYPDIDVDYSRNMELKEHLINKWGENVVVPISNFNTLKVKSLVKDLAKLLGIDYQEVNAVTTVMENEAMAKSKEKHGITSGAYEPTFEDLVDFSPSFQQFLIKYPEINRHIGVLLSQPRSISRHAGGVVIADNLDYHMPLISSKDVVQTPWTEGMAHRHLEPLGFIKFDLLGLSTLQMIEECIMHVLKRHFGVSNPTMEDVLKWHKEYLHADVLNFEDQKVYEYVYHDGNFAGIFQFAEEQVQDFCRKAKPRDLIQLSNVTAIWRPGPLGANVDKEYLKALKDPEGVVYINDIHKEISEPTLGLLVYQEQIAALAHKLGNNITLEGGNKLRKLLTKKGMAGSTAVEDYRTKFVRGCIDKGLDREVGEDMFAKFEFFAQYGFNASHSTAYAMISYKCAWLLTYYPECWCAAYLSVDNNKKKAISEVKQLGFTVASPNVNVSTNKWEISKDGNSLYQPLTDILGLGDAAYKAILAARPFDTIEDLMFETIEVTKVKKPRKTKKNPNPEPVFTTKTEEKRRGSVNKTVIDVLTRTGALDDIIDTRFSGRKHFWTCLVEAHPKNKEELDFLLLDEDIRVDANFSREEEVIHKYNLTKSFPLDDVVPPAILKALRDKGVKPISEWSDPEDTVWMVIIDKVYKTTKNGKEYVELIMLDDTYQKNNLKIWFIEDDKLFERIGVYVLTNLNSSGVWGFSFQRKTKTKDNVQRII